MQIEKVVPSPLKNKRLRVYMNNSAHFDFGLKGGRTYIDGETEKTKENYWKRHLANGAEGLLINNYIASPALFSAYLLWGESRSLRENVTSLNRKLCKISY